MTGCHYKVKALELCGTHHERQRQGRSIDELFVARRKTADVIARNEDGHKKCVICFEWLTEDSFQRRPKASDGRCAMCRTCFSLKIRGDSYGIGPEGILALKDRQDGKCAICEIEFTRERDYYIDHDHSCCIEQKSSCGRCVRGLLCSTCNLLLGYAGDSIERLMAAMKYLEDRGTESS